MDESGPPPGIATISIERDSKPGYIRIRIINGEIEPKVVDIPIGTMTELEGDFLVLEFDNAEIVAASKRNVIIKL